MLLRAQLLTLFLVISTCLSLAAAAPPAHDQFHVAIYITADVVERMKDTRWLQQSWDQISGQVKVDKVYIESYRRGFIADDGSLETAKSFFKAHGVQVAGAIAFSHGPKGHDSTFSYTDPKERAETEHISEVTARHFDEILLDDYFSTNTKTDSDTAARGSESWSQFRLHLMDEVSRDLVVGPARAVNPNVKVIIKYPNWYESYQNQGYDLDQEPKIFDGIYTGTETRDPGSARWAHLQQYESYQIVRYLDNVSLDHNGGGWIDTYGNLYIDRFAEQLWDTMLAKAPEIVLFEYSDLLLQPQAGDRQVWSGLDSTFNYAGLEKWHVATGSSAPINYATVAGYSLSKVNAVLGKLGNPIGLASYKPYQSSGEDYLHNYLGMIGIPIDLHPEFPADAKTVLLTESAKFDPEIVSKIEAHLEKGGNVVITSGLLQALQGEGIEQITEIHAQGNLLTIPEHLTDLYSLPQPVLTSIRQHLLADFPVQIDAPSRVSLFAYDNRTFVVESYLDQPTQVTVSTEGSTKRLRNLDTGKVIKGKAAAYGRSAKMPRRIEFHIGVAPHSFVAFAEE
jgi:hypothetical protein